MSVYGCLLLLQSYHRRLCYPNRSLSQSVEATNSYEEKVFLVKQSPLFPDVFLASVLSICSTGTRADVTKYFISVGVGTRVLVRLCVCLPHKHALLRSIFQSSGLLSFCPSFLVRCIKMT